MRAGILLLVVFSACSVGSSSEVERSVDVDSFVTFVLIKCRICHGVVGLGIEFGRVIVLAFVSLIY